MNQTDINKEFAKARDRAMPVLPRGITAKRVEGGSVGKLYPYSREMPVDMGDDDLADWVHTCAVELAGLEREAVIIYRRTLEERVRECELVLDEAKKERKEKAAIEIAEDNLKAAELDMKRSDEVELVYRPAFKLERVMNTEKIAVWKCFGRYGVRVKAA